MEYVRTFLFQKLTLKDEIQRQQKKEKLYKMCTKLTKVWNTDTSFEQEKIQRFQNQIQRGKKKIFAISLVLLTGQIKPVRLEIAHEDIC